MRRAIAFLAFVLSAVSLHADAWARGRGRTYVHLGFSTTETETAFDETGARVPFPGRGAERKRASLYAEVGVSESLTLVVNAPYEEVTSRGLFNDFTTRGGADLDLRLRLSHATPRGVFAVEGGAFVPLGYERETFPQLGTGAIEPMVNLAYGASLRGLPEGFVSAQLGWRMRGGEVSDELPYSLKIGAFFHPRIGTFAGVRGWESRGTFEDIDPTYALTASDSEALAATGELYVRVHRNVDVSAAWSRPMRGRNSGIGHEWSLGIAIHSR